MWPPVGLLRPKSPVTVNWLVRSASAEVDVNAILRGVSDLARAVERALPRIDGFMSRWAVPLRMESKDLRMCVSNPNLFVISGGPGSGKTTVLQELAGRGFPFAREVARLIIQEQVQSGGTALPWEIGKRTLFSC